jgi:GNAT superfamily N-acetyltransferase
MPRKAAAAEGFSARGTSSPCFRRHGNDLGNADKSRIVRSASSSTSYRGAPMKHLHPPLSDTLLLDNPIWYALSTAQRALAQSNGLAKRFPSDVAPFGGLIDQSAAAYDALEEMLPGAVTALFLDAEPVLPSNWEMVHSGGMYQMTCQAPAPGADHAEENQVFRSLTKADVPDMLALAKLTEPGPFLPRTIELGAYFGVHDSGSLVAMAGERLRLTGFTEISAVCTHPKYRGRGYGNALLSALISRIMRRGETPILHVRTENLTAVRLYEKLGFKVRAQLHLAVIKRGAASPVVSPNQNAGSHVSR